MYTFFPKEVFILPFLKPKREAGLIIRVRKPDGDIPESGEEGQEDHGLLAAAADLIRALHAKDEKAVADAFRAAFEILESQPHEESSHEEPSEDSNNPQ